MIKEHFGLVCLSISIVVAAGIYALATRYQGIAVSRGPDALIEVFDRWTGHHRID